MSDPFLTLPVAPPRAVATASGRLILVGESNPRTADPRYALWPAPPGCAGWRLCHAVLAMAPKDYLARFDRVNLLGPLSPCRWSPAMAGRRAATLQLEHAGRSFVLLGARVAEAFGYRGQPFREYALAFGRALVLPHPSGRCRAWNDPAAPGRARELIADFERAALAGCAP